MNFKTLALILCVIPGFAYSADRSAAVDAAGRASRATSRAGGSITTTMNTSGIGTGGVASAHATTTSAAATNAAGSATTNTTTASGASCRDAYRACMDEFCLLDESEGGRCICSENITAAQKLLADIKKIQAEADELMTTETQRARLGAKADLVMDAQKEETAAERRQKRIDGASGGSNGNADLAADNMMGQNLYYTAADACAAELEACGDRADMEEMLYSRQITADCKAYNLYLDEQKTYAEQNKKAAELAVVNARLEVLDTTNKYNRGECLLAYKACIADKGGCGIHFENCYDEDGALLERRANACTNVLDQCMASRTKVLEDWAAEKEYILTESKKYLDNNFVTSCTSKITLCLEENCSYQTNPACLTDVNVAAGICPIINECEDKVKGIKQAAADNLLLSLRAGFCEDDVEACLKDKCGVDFTGPQCLGKSQRDIAKLCPQKNFPTCNVMDGDDYNVVLSSILLQLDYKQTQGCINYFSEQLGAVCGTDMNCLPDSTVVQALTVLTTGADFEAEKAAVIKESQNAVDEFFKQFEQDTTVAACQTAERPDGAIGKSGLGTQVFNTTKMIARIGAENRALRQLESKRAELSRQQDIATAEKNCYTTYQVEEPDKSNENYSYIRSVAFEPSLRNCHVCRMQQVCETGGEKKATSALKAAAGGLTAGAAMGTQINAGWGTAIGGVIGAVGAGALGAASGGQETFCQEVESCEDLNY